MLMKAVDSYLDVRRAAGYKLRCQGYLLRSFARFATARGEVSVRTASVIEWASEAPSLSQRDLRLKTVERMARHLRIEDDSHEIPPSNVFGYRKCRRAPYIFSKEDFGRLIEAATQLGPEGSLRPYVYSTLFALLWASGLRISEALGLTFEDVTPDGLLIRRTKYDKSRLIPLHETATAGLDRYLDQRKKTAASDNHLFVSLSGRVLDRNSVEKVFRGLLKTTGLTQPQGRRRPRVHDIRHTFAVRALESCPEGRDNIGRHMLALSTYLGHSHVSSTFWYLEATPHLMQDIADACEIYLKGGAS
jgi:integrase